jgi:hypothetical protein
LSAALAIAGVSCSENSPPKNDHNPNAVLPDNMKTLMQPNAGQTIVRASPGVEVDTSSMTQNQAPTQLTQPATPKVEKPKPVVPKEEIVVPPVDAHWTLFVASFDGPTHVQDAKAAKEQLRIATNSNKFYVVHEDARSLVYYGFYKDIDRTSKDGKTAQGDKEYLMGLKTSSGESPLAGIHFEAINSPTPDGPAQWDLSKMTRNADHYWSLQIAAYTEDGRAEKPGDVADRKSAAVESVKALRAHGVEAYFYHGETVSSVCVGVWPENAVKRQSGGDSRGNAASANPNDEVLVAPDLPPNVKSVRSPDGHRLTTLTTKLEILDPKMLETIRQFPTHALNGYEIMRTYGTGKDATQAPDPSIVVMLPEQKSPLPPTQTDAELLNLQLRPVNGGQQQPGAGKLRSVGE